MKLTCNINERGARVRRIWGALCLVMGVTAAGVALGTGIWWLWIIGGMAIGAGAFAFFEARKKWCAVRAMGIKTPV